MINRRELMGAASLLAMSPAIALAQSKNAAEIAVEAAKKYAGTEISIVWEAGLQSLDPLNYSGPKWEQLTGMKVKVVEVPTDQMFTKIVQDYRSGASAYDALNVIPSWMPDLVRIGALEPLDSFVDQFSYRDELQDIAPAYRDNQMKVGDAIYGFPDDGDVMLLYYRKDIFEDPKMMEDFKAKHGYDLAPPKDWTQFADIGQFITDKMAPKTYGAGMFRSAPYPHYMFQERFRMEGGKFFDAGTMKATVNSEAGLKVFNGWLAENKFMPPGVEQWNFVDNLAHFLQGETAMTISWPPYGRWAAGYGSNEAALSWVPKTQIAGKVGYSLNPLGRDELGVGFALSVSSTSKNKEAAYLFIQWLNSKQISLERVQLPYTLRDPFRTSHYESAEYRALWPDAGAYLDTVKLAGETGLLDLSLLQQDKYDEAMTRAISSLFAGEDPQGVLDDMAAQFDAITEKVGVDKQKETYAAWAAKPGAYP
ncbi:MAG TPA: extracellular solute-binding protein [Aestuariivirga sp.]|nr:extracellular solute-binding protein [Aestuariivirga sp.]